MGLSNLECRSLIWATFCLYFGGFKTSGGNDIMVIDVSFDNTTIAIDVT